MTGIKHLPIEEQERLSRVVGALLAHKDRLETHDFKVIKLQAKVSDDMLKLTTIYKIYGIETEIIVDGTLPPGTIKVAALVQ